MALFCILVLCVLSVADCFQHSSLRQDKSSSLTAMFKPAEITAHVQQWCAVNEKPCFRNPTVWGPPTWFFLHSMTLALPLEVPPEKQAQIKTLMETLPDLIPCPSCGVHLKQHMKELPIEPNLGSRDKMVNWMLGIHNKVNKLLGRRAWTEQEMRAEYETAFAKDGNFAAVIGKSFQSSAQPLGHFTFMVLCCIFFNFF